MIKKNHSLICRIPALFLSLSVGLANPALALRPQQPEAPQSIANLKNAFQPAGSISGLEEKPSSPTSVWDHPESGFSYARFAAHPEYEQANQHLVDLLARNGLGNGHTVVDLGSGTGKGSLLLAKALGPAGKVIGVDLSESMITQAQERLPDSLGGVVEFRAGDALQFRELVPENLNAVVLFNSIHLMENPSRLAEEVSAKLAPGKLFGFNTTFTKESVPRESLWAYLAIADKAKILLEKSFPDAPPIRRKRLRTLSQREYRDRIERAGFTVVEEETRAVSLTTAAMRDFVQVLGVADYLLPFDIPLAERQRILAEAVTETMTELGLQTLPRNWLFLVAKKSFGKEEDLRPIIVDPAAVTGFDGSTLARPAEEAPDEEEDAYLEAARLQMSRNALAILRHLNLPAESTQVVNVGSWLRPLTLPAPWPAAVNVDPYPLAQKASAQAQAAHLPYDLKTAIEQKAFNPDLPDSLPDVVLLHEMHLYAESFGWKTAWSIIRPGGWLLLTVQPSERPELQDQAFQSALKNAYENFQAAISPAVPDRVLMVRGGPSQEFLAVAIRKPAAGLAESVPSESPGTSLTVEHVPDAPLLDDLGAWLLQRAPVLRPTEHYGQAKFIFRLVHRDPLPVVAAMAAEEWVAGQPELASTLANNFLLENYRQDGRGLVYAYLGQYRSADGRDHVLIERHQILAPALQLSHTDELEIRSELIETLGEWGKARGVSVHLMAPDTLRKDKPGLKEKTIDLNYHMPVDIRTPRRWENIWLSVRGSPIMVEEGPTRWYRYVGEENSAGKETGLEEQRAAFSRAQERSDGFRSVSPADSLWVVVIGQHLAQKFPGLQVWASIWNNRIVIDRGDPADTITRAAERGDAVHFYGEPEEAELFGNMAGRAQLGFVAHNPMGWSFILLVQEILKALEIPSDVVSSGLENFSDDLQALGAAA